MNNNDVTRRDKSDSLSLYKPDEKCVVDSGTATLSNDYIPTKTVSCENISSINEGKSSFPHAFLRSRPPRARTSNRPPSVPTLSIDQIITPLQSRKSPNCCDAVFDDQKDSLRQKLKAVSEENFPMTWLRRNQTSMKMRLNSHYPRSRHRASSTQSVNSETIVYHSPQAPLASTATANSQFFFSKDGKEQCRLPGNRSSLYISSADSDYECDAMKQEHLRKKQKKTESDTDSGVSSTGSHSETNSDSGSLTGNDSSFDQCSKGETNSTNEKNCCKTENKHAFSTEIKNSGINFCECQSETSQLNLTDEEKLVPPVPDEIHRLPEPYNITSLRQKFLVSQLSKKSSASQKCSSPTTNFNIHKSSHWLERGHMNQNIDKSAGRSLADACSRPPMSLPLSLPLSLAPKTIQVTPPRTYRMMRLTKDSSGELGIYITAKRNSHGTTTGYVIAHIESGGLTDRSVHSYNN